MAVLSQMALLMADINGAYAQSALSCRTRVATGVGFKCTLPSIRPVCVQLMSAYRWATMAITQPSLPHLFGAVPRELDPALIFG